MYTYNVYTTVRNKDGLRVRLCILETDSIVTALTTTASLVKQLTDKWGSEHKIERESNLVIHMWLVDPIESNTAVIVEMFTLSNKCL